MCCFANLEMGKHPFSQGYEVILSSSFNIVLSSALVYSTCSPVSIWGTNYPNSTKFFPESLLACPIMQFTSWKKNPWLDILFLPMLLVVPCQTGAFVICLLHDNFKWDLKFQI